MYATERIVVEDKEDKQTYHKTCLKCSHCNVCKEREEGVGVGVGVGVGGRGEREHSAMDELLPAKHRLPCVTSFPPSITPVLPFYYPPSIITPIHILFRSC